MRGHIAFSRAPFGRGIREGDTILSGGKIAGFLTSFTLLDNRITLAAVIFTALLGHKKTIHASFYNCAKHFNHILFSENIFTGLKPLGPEPQTAGRAKSRPKKLNRFYYVNRYILSSNILSKTLSIQQREIRSHAAVKFHKGRQKIQALQAA
jgi:hypothetical protein